MSRIAPVSLLVLVAALSVAGGATAEPSVGSKQAQAQGIIAQIRQIDADLGRVVEAYNGANVQLDRIEGDMKRNQRDLRVARANLTVAQRRLADRVVQLYTSGGDDSTVAVLLGADSLDELLDRLETADRVSAQESRTLREVISGREAVKRRAEQLARARAEQARVVAAKAAQRQEIERRLAERRSMLASVRDEIARMQAQERRRQRQLASQVRASIASQPDGGQSAAAGSGATEGATNAPPARYGGVVGIAMRYLGVPYKWGGASPSTGFDCSGFTMYVYAQVGISLPHYTGSQWAMGSPVSRDQLQAGDLVFFNNLGHMGIYIGGGNFIHAPRTGDVVKISSLSGWYAQRYMGARRL